MPKQASFQDRSTTPPDVNALAVSDHWALHSRITDAELTSVGEMDVYLGTPEVQEQANAMKASSCKDRGSCEREADERGERSTFQGEILSIAPIGSLAGLVAFLIVRFATGWSSQSTAKGLTFFVLIVTAGLAAVAAVLFGLNGGLASLALAAIWFALLGISLAILGGIWLGRLVAPSFNADD